MDTVAYYVTFLLPLTRTGHVSVTTNQNSAHSGCREKNSMKTTCLSLSNTVHTEQITNTHTDLKSTVDQLKKNNN